MDIIGRFGVGFYSSFMIASKVRVGEPRQWFGAGLLLGVGMV